MAIFDEAAQEPQTPAPEGSNENPFLSKYVGEGKKYKSVEELAKAYDNANNFIPKIQEDHENLKEFVLAQLAERNPASKEEQPNPAPRPTEETPPNKPSEVAPPKASEDQVDIDERIRKALEERDTEKRLQNNSQLAEEVLIRHYGSNEDAVKAVQEKAAEMGVAPQFLADTAFSSPKAFFRLMGITEEAPRSNNTPNASSDINPRMVGEKFGGPKPNTYAWYDSIRKTDPKRYARPEFQAQLMADAMRLGSDFFKR